MFAFNQPLGRLARVPLKAVSKDAVVPVLSGPNRGRRWIAGSLTHGCWLGWYERRCAEFVASMIQPGMTVFDVGANVGYYTLLMARRAGANGRVFAFEPDRSNAALLRRHIVLNRIGNVQVIEAAVSDRTGRSFLCGGGATGRLSSSGALVQTIALDDYPVPDMIKMDIEGAELDALSGCPRLLSKRRTTWLIELHGPVYQAVADLLGRGYSTEQIGDNLLARPC